MENAIAKAEEVSVTLGVQFAESAIQRMQFQRAALKKFVKSQMVEGTDYGTIPGCGDKPSLFKPGAEKLANLFQLGMRIINQDQQIDIEKNWAICTYRVELFHIPTGNVVGQCEGSVNSQERKYNKRPVGEVINTLQKMAQKRAYVGAVVLSVGASDFFTHDIEDFDPGPRTQSTKKQEDETANTTSKISSFVVRFGKFKGRAIEDIDDEELYSYVNYINRKAAADKVEIRGQVLDFVLAARAHLARHEVPDGYQS